MPPSSNWFTLKKDLKSTRKLDNDRPTKGRKTGSISESTREGSAADVAHGNKVVSPEPRDSLAHRDSVDALRKMVLGQLEYSPAHLLPGKFIALDCEMVGIAGDPNNSSSLGNRRNKGDESSLARVSIVNYYGAVQLDVFVRQRERVTDWRTAFSGVRESDMERAKPFSEVQKLVSDLLKDRILVGHAVHNDLKVLLLSHPSNMTRDTQILAGRCGTLAKLSMRSAAVAPKSGIVKIRSNKKPALRKLVSQELGLEIQRGEHSSVVDARATMAIYRLHRKNWDRSFVVNAFTRERATTHLNGKKVDETTPPDSSSQQVLMKRKRSRSDLGTSSDQDTRVSKGIPNRLEVNYECNLRRKPSPGSKKGLSTGLSVVVKRRQRGRETRDVIAATRGDDRTQKTDKWWGTIGQHNVETAASE